MVGSPISLLGIVNPNEIQSALNSLIIQLNEIFNSETSEAALTVADLTVTRSLTANVTGNISLNATGTVSLSPTGALTINPTAASAIDNCTLGVTVPLAVKSTTLTATGAVALSPAGANVVLSPTGSGVVTINPATAGTLNNVVIGGVTPLSGAFTALSATGIITQTAAVNNFAVFATSATGANNVAEIRSSGNGSTSGLWITTPDLSKSITLRSNNGSLIIRTNGDSSNRDNGTDALTLSTTQAALFASTVTVAGTATLLSTTNALTDNSAAQAATLLNGPTAGNPTKWIRINDAGTSRFIPTWT